MDKCEGYGSMCRSFLFAKPNTLLQGYYGRCLLKSMRTTDTTLNSHAYAYGDFFDQVSQTVIHHPDIMKQYAVYDIGP